VRPLAIEGGSGGEADWVKLSRKHAIDVNKAQKYVSIFGGKLTDCINVGNEVAEIIEKFGMTLQPSGMAWYGESTNRTKQQFFEQARAIKLDTLTWENSAEPLSERFWRRYGANAMELLAVIKLDESKRNY